MARQLNRLSPTKVTSLKKPGFYADGGNLYLQIMKGSGAKSWIFRYTPRGSGRMRLMGLGPTHTVGLKEARDQALKYRKVLLAGADPIEERDKERKQVALTAARSMTFDQCRDAYIETHQAGWKNAKHRQQWTNTLATYISPVFGSFAVQDIDTGLVVKALKQNLNPDPKDPKQEFWTTKAKTAGDVRNRVEKILGWATSSEYRSGENPARWRGHLQNLLASHTKTRKVEPRPALPYTQIGEFCAALKQRDGVAARTLEFLIETAARSGEVTGARPEEFDLETKIWTVPAERMKGGRIHRVPLTDRAIFIVRSLIGAGKYVFPGVTPTKPMSDTKLSKLIKQMNKTNAKEGRPRWLDPRLGNKEIVPHGFRSTFRDWAYEQTNFPRDLAEAALAHKVGDETELAYRRGDALDKRRKLMEVWSRYCSAPLRTATVTPLNAGAAR